jgi:hypothetical protein
MAPVRTTELVPWTQVSSTKIDTLVQSLQNPSGRDHDGVKDRHGGDKNSLIRYLGPTIHPESLTPVTFCSTFLRPPGQLRSSSLVPYSIEEKTCHSVVAYYCLPACSERRVQHNLCISVDQSTSPRVALCLS